MSEAPFTAARARALTDTRRDENSIMLLLRTEVMPALRSVAERGQSERTIILATEAQARAVQGHLLGLGYTVSLDFKVEGYDPTKLRISW